MTEQEYMKRKVQIKWLGSCDAPSGWHAVEGFVDPDSLEITSLGMVIFEDDYVISIAQHYAVDTVYTPEQVKGIVTIPKVCIKEIKEIKTE